MGGFTFNGMGWGDSFVPKKDLGSHYCYDCKSIQEFSLMEVKSKIKVLYIPTVTFRTRYAVGCKKCKNGYFVGEDMVRDLLYDRLSIEVTENQIYFHTVGTAQENLTQLVRTLNQHIESSQGKDNSEDNKAASENAAASPALQNPPQVKALQAEAAPESEPLRCKCCGAELKPHQLFCSSCGLRVK